MQILYRTAKTASPMIPPAITSQAEFTLRRNNNPAVRIAMATVSGSINAARPNCHVTAAISPSAATFTPSEKHGGPGRGPQARNHRIGRCYKHKRRKKNPHSGQERAWQSADEIADECSGREDGPWRELADRHGINELPIGEPTEAGHKIVAQER